MKRMICTALVMTSTAALAVAGTPSLKISIGTRETGFAGGPTGNVGDNGGSGGGIEWLDLDGQTLTLDGTWQQFSFDMDMAVAAGFAGASANGMLEGDFGTLEHIRIKSEGFAGPITLWIDDIENTIDPAGPPPAQTLPIGAGFEGFLDGDEVVFQEPGFSGSTAARLMPGGTSAVDSSMAHSGLAAYNVSFQFIDNDPTNWLRLTTFNTPNVPNPIIRYDQDSVVSFWIKGVPEPTTAMLLVPALALLRRRR